MCTQEPITYSTVAAWSVFNNSVFVKSYNVIVKHLTEYTVHIIQSVHTRKSIVIYICILY